ncbi:zinc ribbon domain-containing protein [Nonomuraea sp. NPDC050643]|uniref:zinc ribbon domain-containing protein n=1 Tax=Nonomuraea sp. NPDC050643 TaxID=3155660 RepID=UPI003404BC4E
MLIPRDDPRYTAQTCNACPHIASESRESQALFRCVACRHRDHADVNAAGTSREELRGWSCSLGARLSREGLRRRTSSGSR